MLRRSFMKRKREPNNADILEGNPGHPEKNHTDMKGAVAILWDIDNCSIPKGVPPEEAAGNIRKSLRRSGITGPVTTFSAYGDFSKRARSVREGCQKCGVNLIDVPNGRKDAADKAILEDMFLFALDNDPPSTILLISSDADFASALNKLGQRGYAILVAVLNFKQTRSVLWNAAKYVWEWLKMARNEGFGESPDQILGKKKVKITSAELSVNESVDYGLLSETTEKKLTSSIQPNDIGPGECEMPYEIKTEPKQPCSMQPSGVKAGVCEMPFEATEPNQTFLMQPSNIKPDDVGLPDELAEPNPTSSMQPRKSRSGDFGWPFETTEPYQPSSMQPNGIRPGDCQIPFEATTGPSPSFVMCPINITLDDCGLPSEMTAVSNSTLLQPSNIWPGDLEIIIETSQSNTPALMQPSNIRLGDCGMPFETTTKLYPTSIMQPNNISWEQGKHLFVQSQRISSTRNQNNITVQMSSFTEDSNCGFPSEITMERNPTYLMQPTKSKPGDCGMPSETTELNGMSLMQHSNIWPGDCQRISETTDSYASLSMYPNIRPDDCGLPSETTAESNPSSLTQPSAIGSNDCVLPSEMTGLNPSSSMQPSNISPCTCGLPLETTEPNLTSSMEPDNTKPHDCGFTSEAIMQPNLSSLMQCSNIKPGECGITSETTQSNPFSSMQQAKPLCLQSQKNSSDLKQNNITETGDSGLPFEMTKLISIASMQASNISRGDWGLPYVTTTEAIPSSLIQPRNISLGDCELPSQTIKKPIPTSATEEINMKSCYIDALKAELLMLLHKSKVGRIPLNKIPSRYKQTFNKTIFTKQYGFKLRKLFEEMGNDVFMEGKSTRIKVLLRSKREYLRLRSQKNSNAPKDNKIQVLQRSRKKYLRLQSQKYSNAPKKNNLTEIGECMLSSKTITQANPTSSMWPNHMMPSGIDAVKDNILMLLHKHGGEMTLKIIPFCYKQTFKKFLNLDKYGFELKTLLEEMQTDIYMQEKGDRVNVFLRTQEKYFLGSQKNSNAPKQNDKKASGVCGLPSEIIAKPNPTSSIRSSNTRRSGINAVKDELLMLLRRSNIGRIALHDISSHYKKTFKKELSIKKYGCKLSRLFKEMGDDVCMEETAMGRQVRLRSQGSEKNSNCPEQNNPIGKLVN